MDRLVGRIDLEGNAERELRRLRDQGIVTQAQFEAMGRSLDKVGDREDQQRFNRLQEWMRSVGRTSTSSSREYQRGWRDATRQVQRDVTAQGREITRLERRLDALGRKRATAHVDVDGLAAALAKIELLERRLAALNGRGGRGGGGRTYAYGGTGGSGIATPLTVTKVIGALPLINTAVGAGGAILGSAASGALGAGALGLTGYAGAGIGVGGTALAGKALAADIKGVTEAQKAQQQAQQRLNQAIAAYGRGSSQATLAAQQATAAQDALNKAYREAPEGTRLLLERVKLLKSEFRDLTRPGQSALAESGARIVLAGRRGLRRFGAREINRVSTASGRQAETLANFATGRTGERFVTTGAQIYAENLHAAEQSLEHMLGAWTNIEVATKPFFHDGMQWLERWTGGWETSTRDITHTRNEIRQMVDNLRSWKDLAGATFNLTKDLLGVGAPEGQSAVDRLTEQLDKWDEWVQRNPDKVRGFFHDSVESATKLARALYDVAAELARIGEQLRPLLDRVSEIVSLASSLGLLTPGVGALAYGAFKGAKGAAGASATGAAAAGAAGAGAGAIGKGAAKGALKRFAPVAALLATLDGLNFDGTTAQKIQKGFSTATLGILPGPTSAAQRADQGSKAADQRIREMGGVRGLRDAQQRVTDLQNQIWLHSGAGASSRPGTLEKIGRPLLGIGGQGLADKLFGDHDGERKRSAAEVRRFREALKDARAAVLGFQHSLDDKSRTRAQQAAANFQERFTNLTPRMGADAAFANTLGAVRGRLSRTPREEGKKELARATLEWAQQVAKGKPQMEKALRGLEQSITRSFHTTAKKTAIVNGQILVGTQDEWGKIADAMSSAAQRGVDATSDEMQRLRSVALSSLTDMGYSASEARAIMRGKYSSSQVQARTGSGQLRLQSDSNKAKNFGGKGLRARGGRLPGRGLNDTVPMSDGGLGAPGELVVNRHTEDDHDRDARAAGLPTLAERVARERRKHSDPRQRREPLSPALVRFMARRERHAKMHARGGRLRYGEGGRLGMAGIGAGNSLPQSAMEAIGGDYGGGQLINPRIAAQVRAILSRWHARVTAGWAPVGTHAPNSDHHWGGAVDLVPGPGGSWDMIDQLAAWAEPHQGAPAHGFRWVGYTGDPGHGRGNHLHLSWPMQGAITGIRGGTAGVTAGAGAGAGAQSISLTARRSGLGGVPGALADRATQAVARGLMDSVNTALGGAAGGALGGAVGSLNRVFPRHIGPKAGAARLSPEQVMQIARSVGMPARGAEQIAHGESDYYPGIQQPDPGDHMIGYGLMQNTPNAWGSGSAAMRKMMSLGGIPAMFNPVKNMQMAKFLYDAAGGWSPWYGTRYLNKARGGRVRGRGGMDFAGAFRQGGSFTTRRPTMFIAGEGPEKEQVTVRRVRPRRSGNTGDGGHSIVVHMNFGDVQVADGRDFEKHAHRAAELVARKLLDRLSADEHEAMA